MEEQKKITFFERLKLRWGIQHNWEVAVIFFVFGVTGSLSVKVSKPLLLFFNISQDTQSPWIYWPVRILVSFIAYQILLVTIGTLCGQRRFFWNMEKKMLGRFGIKLK